jgi:hypothetical protein
VALPIEFASGAALQLYRRLLLPKLRGESGVLSGFPGAQQRTLLVPQMAAQVQRRVGGGDGDHDGTFGSG